ncbi:mitochondrial-processing peptidase subunit beta-like [Hylaeus volcanicus]|uniref:mitochondrial-processing peptidase subunit beta-like n=1 Tax=Hylaeus volcanicus TaxID=313075 RepID=UPI0023B843B5|nr:mitochondrial-processing peptidase subunit beta-like [Hylaeus volcanicus]
MVTCLATENSIETSNLSNGMRLVCEYKNTYTATLGCFIPAGAMHEMPEERGSALFLQHLLFKRTRHANQEQLEKTLEELGGKVSAIAMRHMFLFYGTVPSREVNKLIQYFADVILNGTICNQDVEREKCIILHELSKMELNKEQVVMDYLPSIAYQDTMLANSIYPETDVINQFCTENLIEFRKRLFKPPFMTLVCTGPISLQKLEDIVNKNFTRETGDCNNQLSEHSNEIQSYVEPLEYRFSGAELRLRDDDSELGYVAIGVEGPSHNDIEAYFALTVAKEIIGSWNMKSSGANHNAPYIAHRAFNTDLCRMYKSFFHKWTQSTSIWGCYFVCDKLRLEDMLRVVQQEWMRLCTTVTKKEVSRAINQCKTKELVLMNDPENRFFYIVENIFRYGYYVPIQQRLVEYEKITADKIREVSGRYIYDQSPAVVALDRIENLPEYCSIRNGMYLLRY